MNLRQWRSSVETRLVVLAVTLLLAVSLAQAQAGTGQTQSPSSSSSQDIPDAPSTVQPPAPSFPKSSTSAPADQSGDPNLEPGASSSRTPQQPGDQEEHPAPPPMPPVQTIPPGTKVPPAVQGGVAPRNQINPAEDLYTLHVTTSFVQIPVMVRANGRRVDGLLPKDFTVLENGKPQKLTYFTSDPFLLSVAVVLDTGMPDVTLQKVNQTYEALVESFSPYDEFALYTYSTSVSQVTGFTSHPQLLTTSLNTLKLVRGRENGPADLGGPLSPTTGPTINGAPVGGPVIPPVNTPPKELYVLNDAIMEAARGLSQQDVRRRKVILVISDGREYGSQASYKQVIRVLQTHGIQLKAVVLDEGALPGYQQAEKIHHLFRQGYDDILPKYSSATGGGGVYKELTRNSIENAYASITSDSRNQYTLGYNTKPIAGGSPYRSLEVLVDKKGLKIYAKEGFYFVPSIHPPPVQPQ